MRLTAIILLGACLSVSARTHSQTISFQGKAVSLERVFKEVRRQTGYFVFYNKQLLGNARPVSVSAKDMALKDFLTVVLSGQDMEFAIEAQTVLIRAKEKPRSPVPTPNPAAEPPAKIRVRVMDSTGQPLSGASVTNLKTGKAALTGPDGSAQVEATAGDKLDITFVGYAASRILVKDDGNAISIVLKAAETKLDELQIIAYGKTSQRLNTGNITTITAKDIEKSPVSNPLLAIAGRVPGLNINQQSGFSNAGVRAIVQGQTSITGGYDPFYVVDGVPYPSQMLSLAGGMLGFSSETSPVKGSTLSYLNPSDIESITVLKDADATAIYGSRAANGAILITTKAGKAGRTKVGVDFQQGAGKVARKMELMNTRQYLDMRREAIANDGATVGETDYDINGFWDTTRNTDWQREYIGKTARYMTTNASISGGNTAMQYFIGGTYHRETSVMIGDGNNQRGGLNFNITGSSPGNRFQVQLSGNYSVDNNKLPNVDFTNYAMVTAPTAPSLYNDDGTLNFKLTPSGTSTFLNPLVELNKKFNTRTRNLVSNMVLSYNILPGLNIRSSFGYTDLSFVQQQTFPLSSVRPDEVPNSQRGAIYGTSSLSNWIIEPQIGYTRAFGMHKFDMLVGGTIQRNTGEGNEIAGSGYNTDEALPDMRSAATIVTTSVTSFVYKYAGIFGRLNYVLHDRYIVNLSARRDGSSRFGPANRLHNFGAIGAAWIFSMEDLVKDNLPFLSFGKLKFSYGTTGNDQIGDYKFLNLYSANPVGVPYRGIVGLQSNGLFNPFLQWESTVKINAGLDIGVLKDRVTLNANYYRNRSSNQLLPYALPSITGFSAITTNYPATVQNTGLETTINVNIIQKQKFRWTISANATVPRNKLIKFDNIGSSSYAAFYKIGRPISTTNVFRYAGVDPATGLYQFQDGKGGITSNPDFDATYSNQIDLSPKWYGGITNTFSYGGLTLDVFFQYMNRRGSNNFTGPLMPGQYNQNQPTYLLDRWRNTGDNAGHQRFNANSSLTLQWLYAFLSDASYSDASYLRLKNLSLSWQVPEGWLSRAKIPSLRVYAQGQNLLTFTRYKGLDPETLSSTSLPPLKVFVFGVQIVL